MSASEAFLTTLTINGFRLADGLILFPSQEFCGNVEDSDMAGAERGKIEVSASDLVLGIPLTVRKERVTGRVVSDWLSSKIMRPFSSVPLLILFRLSMAQVLLLHNTETWRG